MILLAALTYVPRVARLQASIETGMLLAQGVEELKSIHTLPSLLLYENGVLAHTVEGTGSVKGLLASCLPCILLA